MRTSDLAKYSLPVVTESVGFPNRKPGDTYYDPTNDSDVATFVKLISLPEGGLQFKSPQERDLALQYWKNGLPKHNTKVYMLNRPASNFLALYIVHFDVSGTQEYYVKYIDSNKRLAGKLTSIPAGIKSPTHGGYELGEKKSKSERMPIKPSNIFENQGPFTPQQIYNKIKRYQSDTVPVEVTEQMAWYVKQVIEGNAVTKIRGGEKWSSVHTKYTGEFSAPIALMTGQVLNPEVLGKIEQNITNGNSLSDAKIQFPMSLTQKLIDSELIWPDGTKIGLSSKSGTKGGASASLEGLQETISKNSENPDFQKAILEKYPAVVDLIDIVVNHTAIDGFLALMLKYKVLSKEETKLLIDMLNNIKEGKPKRNTKKYIKTTRLKHYYKNYNANSSRPGYNLFFHLLGGAGKELQERLNRLPITEAIKGILNYASLVQMYTETKPSGKDLEMQGFRAVWPPVFDGEVKIDLSKTLTGSQVRGKVNFKIG